MIDAWWIQSEYVTVAKGSTALAGAEITSDVAYLEVAYKLNPHSQIAGSYDWQDNKFGSGLGLAVNYWFSPNLVIKTEYHNIEGGRFIAPGWNNFWQVF